MITTYAEYLEKPSVLTFEDMNRLHEAGETYTDAEQDMLQMLTYLFKLMRTK